MRRYLTILVLLVPLLFALPHQAAAVDWFPIVPCGLNTQPANATRQDVDATGKPIGPHDYTQKCNQCLLIELGKNVIDMTFFAIVPSVGTLMFMIAGFIILFNARSGKPGGVETGKKIMTDTAIGIAIILSAWLITNFILKSLVNDQVPGTPWYQINCTTGTLEDLVNRTAPQPPSPGTPPGTGIGTGTTGGTTGTGGTCVDSTWNLCQAQAPTSGCASLACSQYASLIQQYAKGSATVAVIKGLLGVENASCNPNADSGKAYGLMQLKPDTATPFKQKCNITDSITAQWLKDHPQESVCLAVEYINSLAAGTCGSSTRNIAAGYNGGPGACNTSADCLSTQSCGGGQMMAWECVYDDTAHTVCNADRPNGSFKETRSYVMGMLYCMNNPGF